MRRAALCTVSAAFLLAVGAAVGAQDRETGRPASDGVSGEGVKVAAPGAACDRVDADAAPFVAGGCRRRASATGMKVEIRTLFATMPFGTCPTSMDVSFARDGRFWLDRINIGGGIPCNDVWPCPTRRGRALARHGKEAPLSEVQPWTGRLVVASPDGARGSFRLCVETCLGRYVGQVDVSLVRRRAGWRLRMSAAGVGHGSLQLSADWQLLSGPALIVEGV